jgi:hypothetical protein
METYPSAGTAPFSAPFNILVADEEYAHYWYAQIFVALTPGGPAADLGLIELSPLPTAGTITVTTSAAPSLPPSVEPGTYVSLRYPGGAGEAPLGQATSSVLSLAVPDILGATLLAGTSMGVTDNDAGTATQWTTAVTSDLPLTTTSTALALEPPCAWVAPSVSGAALPTTSTLSWLGSSPGGVSQIWLLGAGGGFISIVTDGTTAPLDTLVKTGVVVPPGDYTLVLFQLGPNAGLDALVASPGGALQLFDGANGPMWQTTATLRVTFTP